MLRFLGEEQYEEVMAVLGNFPRITIDIKLQVSNLMFDKVLLVYGLAFMVILPVVVGTWWYRSIRYSGDQILINTTQHFMQFMYRTPNMNMKRLGMVLTAASEFDPRNNKEATIRPTDNIEVPELIRDLGNINVKKKEPPFCSPYSLKARVLMLSHLARMEVSEDIKEGIQATKRRGSVMAGQQFQYDDSGNTFFYFLTSFVGLIVIPATYYFWPRDQNAEQLRLKALRKVHGRCLWYRLRLMKSKQSIIPTLKKVALLIGWVLFLFLAYKVSKIDREYQEYNPYEVLSLDPGASVSEIKRQYRLLSLRFHPDKGGDEVMFMRIAKAHAALTNEESRNNWQTYGNPDGPQGTFDAISLNPENAAENREQYARAVRSVLKDDGLFIITSCNWTKDQLLSILCKDQQFVVRKSPALLQEMVNVGCQLTRLANSHGGFPAPRLVSIENCMKLSQMIVQGLQEFKSPLLQLPHFEEEHLRYCVSKKYKVRSIQDLVSLKDSDRRNMLRFLGEEQYEEVMAVLGNFPRITIDIKLQVVDDEDSNNITAGSLVTVTVTLTRKMMLSKIESSYDEEKKKKSPLLILKDFFEKEQEQVCAPEDPNTEEGQGDVIKNKSKVWQNKNKAAKKTSKSKKKKLKQQQQKQDKQKQANGTQQQQQQQKQDKQKQANGTVAVNEVVPSTKEEEDEVSGKGSDSEEGETNKDSPSERDDESDTEPDEMGGDDEEEWKALQQSIQRKERALLETKSKITHPVYSLYFPEVELKFPAPSKPGNYQYSVILRSDSFMGLDQIKPLKLEVHQAKQMPDNHPQWDIPETEEEEEDQEDSDGIEESEEEDNE
ncbi:Translocation protein SEC63-like [Acipenser ruthenus]|uniref:Translocation protein SEC63-like n=1 Tax=Acipenser ruthenus TaxID=7906 RepID=A0A444UE74_ACIRT|nr:Translocation protein SEC63-like [Acipenser ruthenus]